MPMQISPGGAYSVFAHESLTVSTASIGVTQSTAFPGGPGNADAYYALFSIESNPVRFWLDGTAPTSSLGHLLAAGSVLEVHGNVNIQNLRFIRQGGADATVMASYGR